MKEQAKAAKTASYELAVLSGALKNKAIIRMAGSLKSKSKEILLANRKDLTKAKGLSPAMLERLTLNEQRIKLMADSLSEVSRLKDPVGEVIEGTLRPNGLWIQKVRVPLGVVAVIYESRPNVTSDCIGLCLKSGNACILKGGSEAINTNRVIYHILKNAAVESGIPAEAINFVDTPRREALIELLGLSDSIDLVIPRGGEGLIRFVQDYSKIPVIKHYKGVCHTYVDRYADLKMAEEICFNAKAQRPGVCNAMETLLVHNEAACDFLPGMLKRYAQAGVEIRGCDKTIKLAKQCFGFPYSQSHKLVPGIKKAQELDWYTEYLDLILSVKVVESLDQAIRHINHYGSHHSDSIITEKYDFALEFLNKVDSACVYVNASTRFTDGYEFGMGAEIGISTDKLHARGPMALEELTTYKYLIFGNGQIRI